MIAVTSFSEKGYDQYGRECLKSFVKHWPCDIVVYYESDLPPDFEHEKIIYRRFWDIPNTSVFYHTIGSVPQARGMIGGEYNYNFDLWKFSRKMFAQFETLANHEGKVFWLDADSITKEAIPESFLENLFEDKCLVYLGREGFYTETGFVGFDTTHRDFTSFFDRYVQVLQKGIILTLERWHDCEAFDWARHETSGNNLSSDWKKGLSLHVLPKSVLGKYLTHNKGNRKLH